MLHYFGGWALLFVWFPLSDASLPPAWAVLTRRCALGFKRYATLSAMQRRTDVPPPPRLAPEQRPLRYAFVGLYTWLNLVTPLGGGPLFLKKRSGGDKDTLEDTMP